MAKPKLTEKVIEKHTLGAEGFLDLANGTIEIEEVGVLSLQELLENFDGQLVKIAVQTQTEKDFEEIGE